MRTCKFCGNEFEPYAAQRYCTTKCRYRSEATRNTVPLKPGCTFGHWLGMQRTGIGPYRELSHWVMDAHLNVKARPATNGKSNWEKWLTEMMGAPWSAPTPCSATGMMKLLRDAHAEWGRKTRHAHRNGARYGMEPGTMGWRKVQGKEGEGRRIYFRKQGRGGKVSGAKDRA